jgi:hypothetical protein
MPNLSLGYLWCALLQKRRGVPQLIESLWRCNRAAVRLSQTQTSHSDSQI